jgi:hypothetical protein
VKWESLVDSMAKFLKSALDLKGPELMTCKSGKTPVRFLEVMNDEMRYMATFTQLKLLATLKDNEEFAKQSGQVAVGLMAMCRSAVQCVNITEFANTRPFFEYRELVGCRRGDIVILGGIQLTLQQELEVCVGRWLRGCDRLICIANEESWDENEEVSSFVNDMSRAISQQLSLCSGQKTAFCPLYIEARIKEVVTQTAVECEIQRTVDVMCLKTLRVIADGRDREAIARILQACESRKQIRHLIASPPPELGVCVENEHKMNFDVLQSAISCKDPLEVRIQLALLWSAQHGAHAQHSIQEALRRLYAYNPEKPTSFVDVCTKVRQVAAMEIPEPPFTSGGGGWYVKPMNGPTSRLGSVKGDGRRVIRLGSMLWTMAAHGLFKGGFIHKDVVWLCAVNTMHRSKHMCEIIANEKLKNNIGCRLELLKQSIHDVTSDVSAAIDVMMCDLSKFSLLEIMENFHSDGRDFKKSINPLGERMRDLFANRRSSPLAGGAYHGVAKDTLALFLETVVYRRTRLQISYATPPNILGDLLRSVHEVHAWEPSATAFRVTLAMLRRSHPQLREALEFHAAEAGSAVVKSKRGDAVSFDIHGTCLQNLLLI